MAILQSVEKKQVAKVSSGFFFPLCGEAKITTTGHADLLTILVFDVMAVECTYDQTHNKL